MEQTETQAIITMIIALISCVSSFYLWVILFLRKKEYQRTRHDTNYTNPPNKYDHPTYGPHNKYANSSHRKFSYTTYYNITIYTQFVYYMAMYQTILSMALTLVSINEYKQFTNNSNCNWTSHFDDILCFLSRCIITYFLIGSISWYFMITITICSSLFNRVSISNINKIQKYHFIVIFISLFVALTEFYIANKRKDYDFSQITTILPTIIIESIYLCVCCMAIFYIKCCYPFYFVGEDRFRMILYLVVFVTLWLFPSLYNMFPSNIKNNSSIFFAKQICINLTGLATMIIWRFLSVFPNHAMSSKSPSKYRSVDDDDQTPVISDGQSSVSGHTTSYPMNKNGTPVTRRDINSYSPNDLIHNYYNKISMQQSQSQDDNISEAVHGPHHVHNVSNDSSILWFNRYSSGNSNNNNNNNNNNSNNSNKRHKKNMLSTTSGTSSNMMPALPNNSYSSTATSLLSNGNDGNIEYGVHVLRKQSTNQMDDNDNNDNNDNVNDLCLSPSQSIKKEEKKSGSSYFERAKKKIFKNSITDFFGSMSKRSNNNKDSLIVEDEYNDNKYRRISSNDEEYEEYERRSKSIRINNNNGKHIGNIASEDQYDYYVHTQNGMIPPPSNSLTQQTPKLKTIKLPNGEYIKRLYDANDININEEEEEEEKEEEEDKGLMFKYTTMDNAVNIYDSDYDEALDGRNNNNINHDDDPYEAIEKGHVWQRTP